MNTSCGISQLRRCIKSFSGGSIRKWYATAHVPPEIQYLVRGDGIKIAYRRFKPPEDQRDTTKPGIVFCPGFQSTMEGVKALSLEKYCMEKGLHYVRFCLNSSFKSGIPSQTTFWYIFTVHKRSCRKIMFLHLSVILFTGEEGVHPMGRHMP